MLSRRLASVPLAVALLAGAAPAHAVDNWIGLLCGFTSTNDPTGVIIQDPTKQTGEIDCLIWIVFNIDGGTIDSVSLTACIKVNDSSYGGGVCRSSTTAGSVGSLVDTISYNAAVGDDVYICGTASWTGSKGGGSVNMDYDDVTPGEQCGLATSIEA